jgi:hypothetical protein
VRSQVVIAVAAVALLGGATAFAAIGRPDTLGSEQATEKPALPRAEAREPQIRRAQNALLAQIVRGFPERLISGRVGRPPREDRRPRASFVYYKLRVASGVQQVHGSWQAIVSSGVLRAESRARGLPPVLGHRFTLVRPDGRERFESESVLGDAFRGRITRVSAETAADFLRDSASSVGARLVSVRFPRPLGHLAAEAVVETTEPRVFASSAAEKIWEIALPLNRGAGRPRAEGVYIEVRTPAGEWVAASGYGVRISEGSMTVNPRFQ